jgi:RHS repeat-associated protein
MTANYTKLIALLFLLLVANVMAYAGNEPYENYIKGSLKVGDSVWVKDEKFKNPNYNWPSLTHKYVKNYLSLRIIDEQPIAQNFEAEFKLRVAYYTSPSQINPAVIDTVRLKVNYKNGVGEIYALSDYYEFTGAHEMRVYVDQITSPQYGSSIPVNMQLTAGISVDRIYPFEPLVPITFSGNIVNGNNSAQGLRLSSQSNGTANDPYLNITIPVVVGATEYDLEWTPVDEPSDPTEQIDPQTITPEIHKGLFKNNATRVTLKDRNEYSIPLIYNAQWIAVRVRGVSYNSLGIRIEGEWAYTNEQYQNKAIWNIQDNWHESNLNWQYAVSFAEEGKRKEVISYFDGSLRNRQTVTLLNETTNSTDSKPIVQENIYDEFGRVAANILPAPTNLANYLKYFPSFNMSASGVYNYSNLNLDNCQPVPDRLDNSSGAGAYYSNNNPFNSFNFNKYIPNADGYPLSVNLYTLDNTGRIAKQGGVGTTFQPQSNISADKTTKYYYGKPEQWELDAIFGNDVGFAEHYLKNMVIDPNGQASISYLNASGKTIATALTGNNETNLTDLSFVSLEKKTAKDLNSTTASRTKHVTLLKPENFSFDANTIRFNASTSYVSSIIGPVQMNYSIQQLISHYQSTSNTSICNDCFYTLKVDVKDDCGSKVDTTTIEHINIGNLGNASVKRVASLQAINVNLQKIGTYFISVTIELDKNVVQRYTDQFVEDEQKAGRINSEQYYVLQELGKLDFSNCFKGCDALTQLGSEASFKEMFNQKLDDLGKESSPYTSYINGLYNSLHATALASVQACGNQPILSPCDEKEKEMLADVSPGGQYALFDEQGTALEPSANILFLHLRAAFTGTPNPEDEITLQNGDKISPYNSNFQLADLLTYWKPSWAQKFLRFHPEYCKLEFCRNNLPSEQWDDELKKLALHPNYAQANTGNWLMSYDPFFATGGQGASVSNEMANDLNNYSNRILHFSESQDLNIKSLNVKNLLQYTLFNMYTPAGVLNSSTFNATVWNNFSAGSCSNPSQEWVAYRDIYLQLKQKYIQQVRKETLCADQCEVGSNRYFSTGTNCATVYLPQSAYKIGENSYSYSEDFNKYTYYFVTGTEPNLANYGAGAYKYFYPCLDLILPGSSDVIRYRNVWQVYLQEQIYFCETDYQVSYVSEGQNTIDVNLYVPSPNVDCNTERLIFVNIYVDDPYSYNKTWLGSKQITLPLSNYITVTVQKPWWWNSYYYEWPHEYPNYSYYPNNIYACGKICLAENNTLASCPSVFQTKTARFPSPPLLDTRDISQTSSENKNITEMQAMVADVCSGNVDRLMELLALGIAQEQLTQAKQNLLRNKLLELCQKSASASYPYASSTLGPNVPNVEVDGVGCRSFGEIIAQIFYNDKNHKFSELVNPYLSEAPYPYADVNPSQPAQFYNKMQINDVYLSKIDQQIWGKLQALRVASPSPNGSLTDFHAYLTTRFGSAMNLKLNELEQLWNSQTCNYVLPHSIKLPVFLHPDTKGYITRAEYLAAKASLTPMFNSLSSTAENYPMILGNYLNHKFGFSLSGQQYLEFENSTANDLCNKPAYAEPEVDQYACAKNLIATAVYAGMPRYETYLAEQKRLYMEAYIAKFGQTKTTISLTTEQKIYHYTLYYYDQAGNLIRTVPPEGVATLTEAEQVQVQRYRESAGVACSVSTQPAGSSSSDILQQLSTTLSATGNRALEFWLYQAGSNGKQFLATTPDHKYLMQICAADGKLNVDIYNLNQQDPNSISIVNSNHFVATVGGLSELPWLHIVVQGTNLANGYLEVWVNGELQSLTSTATPAGCGWQIGGNPLQMPSNLSALKHLRHYDRLMSANEILANAKSNCLLPSSANYLVWHRYNVPNAGDPTTINATSNAEVQYKEGVYPSHLLTTSYVYNSANQVIEQNSPDAGTSYFWYDFLNRLVLSQNAKQKPLYQYSYTKYEAILGRITEVGQKTLTSGDYNHTDNEKFRTPNFIQTLSTNNNSSEYDAFLAKGTNTEITETIYDEEPSFSPGTLNNTRKRVTASIYRPSVGSTAINASYYSYDINGNVKTLYQQINGLGVKRLDYEYDLVSGKVNLLAYQHGQADAFYYKYNYDAENRLTEAWSALSANIDDKGFGSSLGANKRLDATYQYYLHGPLARMELGDETRKVQGVDYAYTLQGWLKGVNGTALGINDIGADGSQLAKDALAFSLGYYPGDYEPIGGTSANAFAHQFQPTGTTTVDMNGAGRPLFNGNISHSTYAIAGIAEGGTTGYTYGYDQLNRLIAFRQHALTSNSWDFASASHNFKEDFTYDGMGNILTLKRKNQNGTLIDDFKYHYYYQPQSGTGNNIFDPTGTKPGNVKAYTNQLANIDGSNTSNYQYDEIGNLKKDRSADIDVKWTVYGKIAGIEKTDAAQNIAYSYDAAGNRVSKLYNNTSSYYVRDAQGNTLAVYTKNGNTAAQWEEQYLYGSSRLGLWRPQPDQTHKGWVEGRKSYELSNHLGNVMAVINDNPTPATGGGYAANVLSANDYYAFGSQMPGRSVNLGGSYRYGFNGKENDNEVKGEGNQQDYGMRIYDPRIGRFLSVDPLTRQYSELTPYQFASNTPIQAIDLDGMEGAVIIGSTRQVEAVKTYNSKTKLSDRAWEAFDFVDLKQAKLSLQNHKAQGNKILVVLIQAHGAMGQFAVGAGNDGKVDTQSQILGQGTLSDDQPLTADNINLYLEETKRIGGIKDRASRNSQMMEFRELEATKLVEDFLGVINEIEDGGTVILNGCLTFAGEEGQKFSDALLEITGKRINVLGPEDFVSDLPSRVNANDRIFSGGLIPTPYQNRGYTENSVNTGKNLKLNGSGKPFDLVPLDKDKKEVNKP